MPNDAARAEFWKAFVLTRCRYPAPERLEAHLAAAVPHSFCPCGCNGSETTIAAGENPPPLAAPGSGGMFFEADFRMADGRQLEVMLFVDKDANLAGIDVDCQGNTEPVPEEPALDHEPFRVWACEQLIR